MNNNIKVAKQLVKIAKQLISKSGYTYGYHPDHPVRYEEDEGHVDYCFDAENQLVDYLIINGQKIQSSNIVNNVEFLFTIKMKYYWDEASWEEYSIEKCYYDGIHGKLMDFYDGDNKIPLNDDDEIEFDAWYLSKPFKGKFKDLYNYFNDENNLNKVDILDEDRLLNKQYIFEDYESDDIDYDERWQE